jgi:hypothetical protein
MTPNMRFLVLAFAPLLVALGCASGGSSTPTPTATAPDPAPAQAQVKDPKPVGVALSLESIYFDTDRLRGADPEPS